MNKMLEGLKVVVTRPQHQAEALCKLIEDHGGKAICFPVIEINKSENQQAAKRILDNIEQYDIGIFISRNAVDWTMKLLGDKSLELEHLNLCAIGATTADVLEQSLLKNVITNDGMNSESLLEIDALSVDEISGKKIIIFRGEGGREHLATILRERGAWVDYAEVYRCDCPNHDKDLIDRLWERDRLDVVIITSNNGLENLFTLLNREQRNLLLSKQLVVMGSRMLDFSINYGFTNLPILAEENSDEGIFRAIMEWAGSLTRP
jgi:uroporphyrinogen-III synthase